MFNLSEINLADRFLRLEFTFSRGGFYNGKGLSIWKNLKTTHATFINVAHLCFWS